jgi:hypothetical protein
LDHSSSPTPSSPRVSPRPLHLTRVTVAAVNLFFHWIVVLAHVICYYIQMREQPSRPHRCFLLHGPIRHHRHTVGKLGCLIKPKLKNSCCQESNMGHPYNRSYYSVQPRRPRRYFLLHYPIGHHRHATIELSCLILIYTNAGAT